MAYAPWVKVCYAKNVRYADIKDNIFKGLPPQTSTLQPLSSLTGEADLLAIIDLLDKVLADIIQIDSRTANLSNPEVSVTQHQDQLITEYTANKTTAQATNKIQNLFGFVMGIVRTIEGVVAGTSALTHTFTSITPPGATKYLKDLVTSITDLIAGTLKPAMIKKIMLEKELVVATTEITSPPSTTTYIAQWNIPPRFQRVG